MSKFWKKLKDKLGIHYNRPPNKPSPQRPRVAQPVAIETAAGGFEQVESSSQAPVVAFEEHEHTYEKWGEIPLAIGDKRVDVTVEQCTDPTCRHEKRTLPKW